MCFKTSWNRNITESQRTLSKKNDRDCYQIPISSFKKIYKLKWVLIKGGRKNIFHLLQAVLMGVLDFCLACIYIQMERPNVTDMTKCFTPWVSASYIH